MLFKFLARTYILLFHVVCLRSRQSCCHSVKRLASHFYLNSLNLIVTCFVDERIGNIRFVDKWDSHRLKERVM